MAEVEVGGIKFRGGKIFVILTALTTAGGALWGGFEFYKDYLNMKDQIQEYVAPDLSGFDKEIALTKEEMESKIENIKNVTVSKDKQNGVPQEHEDPVLEHKHQDLFDELFGDKS